MNNKGITYFRLNSPYEGDITKNCALDGYEVDNNFFTLEGRDIASVYVENDQIKVGLLNGDTITSGEVFDKFAQNLSFDFDSENGILYISMNGTVKKIEGFVTVHNDENAVATDSTIIGNGKPSSPLSISPVYKTGTYEPVRGFIDMVNDNKKLPCGKDVLPGDRYLVYTQNSDYGLLYDYEGIKRIACDLVQSHSEWRIPTKEDWDDMLNAVEPCAEDRDHSSASSNKYLGRFAGKFLKSKYLWKPERHCCTTEEDNETCINYPDSNTNNCGCYQHNQNDAAQENGCTCGKPIICEPMNCGEYEHCPHRPCKPDNRGIDKFGYTVTPAGYADDGDMYGYFGERAWYWTATNSHSGASAYTKRFEYNKSTVYQDIVPARFHLSLRLVKDYNGNNFLEREHILCDTYPTVLMPSLKSGHKVWTSVNVALANRCYKGMQPNDGQGITMRKKYLIYEWDGHRWLVNELKEGETVVILDAPNNRYSSAYKVINGELIDLDLRTVNNVLNIIQPRLDNLECLINTERDRAIAEEERLAAAIDSTTARLDNEILERRAADEELDAKILAEKEARETKDAELEQAIADEVAARTAADEALTAALEQEALQRAEKDAELEQAIADEKAEREAKDAELEQAIADEVAAREAKDAELEQAIADEAAAREAKDAELEQAIADEAAAREAKDAELEQAIADEVAAREAKDAELEQAIADEAAAREAKDVEIEGKLLTEEGTEFDKENGILTLKSAAGTNDITVQFSFNFGEI